MKKHYLLITLGLLGLSQIPQISTKEQQIQPEQQSTVPAEHIDLAAEPTQEKGTLQEIFKKGGVHIKLHWGGWSIYIAMILAIILIDLVAVIIPFLIVLGIKGGRKGGVFLGIYAAIVAILSVLIVHPIWWENSKQAAITKEWKKHFKASIKQSCLWNIPIIIIAACASILAIALGA